MTNPTAHRTRCFACGVLLIFAGVTRGNKAGGFNAPQIPGLLSSQMAYDPEVLTNYEAVIEFKGRELNEEEELELLSIVDKTVDIISLIKSVFVVSADKSFSKSTDIGS